MKRYTVLIALFMTVTVAHAQQRTLSPEDRQRASEVLNRWLPQQGQFFWNAVGGAWWTNPDLAARIGLTDDQKAKLQRAFDNHRQSLTTSTETINKEEAQLAKLLEAEPLDRNAVLAQIDRVVQARSELERTNAAMTLEMREALTRAQWMQVPQLSSGLSIRLPVYAPAGGGRGPRGDGQRSGGQRQQ